MNKTLKYGAVLLGLVAGMAEYTYSKSTKIVNKEILSILDINQNNYSQLDISNLPDSINNNIDKIKYRKTNNGYYVDIYLKSGKSYLISGDYNIKIGDSDYHFEIKNNKLFIYKYIDGNNQYNDEITCWNLNGVNNSNNSNNNSNNSNNNSNNSNNNSNNSNNNSNNSNNNSNNSNNNPDINFTPNREEFGLDTVNYTPKAMSDDKIPQNNTKFNNGMYAFEIFNRRNIISKIVSSNDDIIEVDGDNLKSLNSLDQKNLENMEIFLKLNGKLFYHPKTIINSIFSSINNKNNHNIRYDADSGEKYGIINGMPIKLDNTKLINNYFLLSDIGINDKYLGFDKLSYIDGYVFTPNIFGQKAPLKIGNKTLVFVSNVDGELIKIEVLENNNKIIYEKNGSNRINNNSSSQTKTTKQNNIPSSSLSDISKIVNGYGNINYDGIGNSTHGIKYRNPYYQRIAKLEAELETGNFDQNKIDKIQKEIKKLKERIDMHDIVLNNDNINFAYLKTLVNNDYIKDKFVFENNLNIDNLINGLKTIQDKSLQKEATRLVLNGDIYRLQELFGFVEDNENNTYRKIDKTITQSLISMMGGIDSNRKGNKNGGKLNGQYMFRGSNEIKKYLPEDVKSIYNSLLIGNDKKFNNYMKKYNINNIHKKTDNVVVISRENNKMYIFKYNKDNQNERYQLVNIQNVITGKDKNSNIISSDSKATPTGTYIIGTKNQNKSNASYPPFGQYLKLVALNGQDPSNDDFDIGIHGLFKKGATGRNLKGNNRYNSGGCINTYYDIPTWTYFYDNVEVGNLVIVCDNNYK